MANILTTYVIDKAGEKKELVQGSGFRVQGSIVNKP